MSLGGLAIAIGLVIDDAIVVVENIHRHRAAGEPVALAAEKGTQELLAAVVGSTLTTVVVFVPLGLLEGVVGQFFAALSLTLAAAVLLSLAYALLFIPNAAARFLTAREAHTARLRRGCSTRYRSLLRAALAPPAAGGRRHAAGRRARRPPLLRARDGLPARDGRGRLRGRLLDARRHVAGGDGPHGAADRGGAAGDARGGRLRPAHRRRAGPVRHRAEPRRHRGAAQAARRSGRAAPRRSSRSSERSSPSRCRA